MELNDQTDKMLKPKKDETFFDKYVAGEKTKGMFNPSTRDVVDFGSDFIPGVSETKDIISLGTNVNKGEYKSAGIDLASLILGAVPVVGDLARKSFKTLTKNVGKSEDVVSKQADEVGESLQKVYGNIKPPKKTTKAYKLFKADKKGNLYPLFVKMQGNKPLELNKWTKAEAGEINPKTGKVKSSLGDLAYRPGFHGGDLPIATHIGGKKGKVTKPNYRKDNQVWAEVEFGDDVDWQSIANSRALKNKDGSISVKTAHITDQVPEGGVYRYKTNPNMTGNWLIGGELKINRILPDKEVKNINNKAGVADLPRLKDLKLAKGGTVMNMNKQMEMFEDGGLKDEGGMIDEVSGNDVPSGSTREEVRDDIPAQLSEGEFVFPADVVRFLGLEKLMQMRQKAKMGLQKMESMGQMGNSEEATMPDDMPFDINDLDMQEDVDNESEMDYNRGGVVKAAVGTYVAPTVPTGYQPLGTNPMGNPTQTAQQVGSGVTGTSIGTPYTPNISKQYGGSTDGAYAPVSYNQFLGTSAAGAPQTESVRYFNEATGQTRMIPHVLNADGTRGDTIYPIPEGFVIQEEAIKEEAKKTTQVQSAKVAPVESGDGGDGDNISTLGGATMDVGGREFALGYNFDGSITLTDPNTMETKTYNKDSQITKDAKAVTMGQIVELSKLTPAGIKTALVTSIANKLGVRIPGSTKIDDIKRKQQQAKNRLNKTFSGIGDDPSTGMSIEDMDTIQSGLEGKEVDKEEMQRLADKVKDIVDNQSYNLGIGSEGSALGGPTAASYSTPSAVASASSFGDDNSSDNSSSGGDSGMDASSGVSDDGGGWTAKGGLMNKKKIIMHKGAPKANKRMKRGGLASR